MVRRYPRLYPPDGKEEHAEIANMVEAEDGTMEDAEFIAAARQDVPDLVAEVKRQQVEIEQLKAKMRDQDDLIERLHDGQGPWL